MIAAMLMVSSVPAGAANADPGPPPTITEEQAVTLDAAAIAGMEGITPAQAEGVIVRQAAIGEVIPKLEAILGEANAGISVDVPEESRTLNVRVAGKLSKATLTKLRKVGATLSPHGVTIDLIEGVEHSLAELTAAAEALDTAGDQSGEVLGVGVDVTTNELFAEVTRFGTVAEEATAATSTFARAASTPAIRVTERLVASASNEMYGGAPMTTCTTGFSVKNSAGSTGFLTAGHCGNSQKYSITSPFTTWFTSTFVTERLNATTDMQWHKVSSSAGAAKGYFYGQSGSSATQRTGSGAPYGGLYICHRGKTTGYSCGNVGTVTYKPTYSGACGTVACSAVYATVTSLTLKSEGGDSGGPWFMGGTAYGIHKGANKVGDGRTAFFTPIARISGFSGLSLL